MKLLIFLLGTTLVKAYEAPSLSEYERARTALFDIVDRGNNLPESVRLAFHDCVGPDGCDGCLNLDDADNVGLSDIITVLTDLRAGNYARYDSFADTISNADFWQMAGIVALELGNSDVHLTFKGGREDCAESPGDSADHTYPEPIMDRHEMYDWFLNSVDGFGMDENKVTALMGAHSLGMCHEEKTGYNGPWTPEDLKGFNNEFYQNLVNSTFTFRNRAMVDPVYDDEGNLDTSIDYKYQWRLIADGEDSDSGTLRLMLNTDLELVYDIDVDNFGDGTDCTVVVGGDETDASACSIASTASLVQTYADDEATFLADFKVAYEMMMEKCNYALTEPV